jgi:hypothetical protein
MKSLLFICLIITVSCVKKEESSSIGKSDATLLKNDRIKFNTLDFDTGALKQLIIKNDKLLGILKIELSDKERAKKINSIVGSDSHRLRAYESSIFKITSDRKCNGYRHLLISKSRNDKNLDLEPYNGLFLLIIDPNDNIMLTEKLEEKSVTMGITSTTHDTNWNLKPDSLLTINSKSIFCSDNVTIEQGITCWTETIKRSYKLNCDELKLVSKDSLRIENKELR